MDSGFVVALLTSPWVRQFARLSVPFKVLVVLGVLVVLRWILRFLSFVFYNWLRPGKNLKAFGAGRGAYAVVTGATDGIGKEYAKALARRGFNILLISRSQEKLDATAAEIKELSPKTDVKCLAYDCSKMGDDFPELLKKFNLDIGVLVNNVGVSYDYPTYFHELPTASVRQLIDLNIKAATEITHAVLKFMIPKKRGLILNISSASSLFPAPLLSVYSGSKSFINLWSQGLSIELRQHGIYVECQTPHYVATKLSKIRKSSLSVPSAAAFVKQSLSKLGWRTFSSPWVMHQIEDLIINLLPIWFRNHLVFRNLNDVRRRALKRAAVNTTATTTASKKAT